MLLFFLPCVMFSKFITSYFAYFTTNLGSEAFELPFPNWYETYLFWNTINIKVPILARFVYFIDKGFRSIGKIRLAFCSHSFCSFWYACFSLSWSLMFYLWESGVIWYWFYWSMILKSIWMRSTTVLNPKRDDIALNSNFRRRFIFIRLSSS